MAAVFDWVREANRSTEAVGRDDLAEMLEVLGLANLLEQTDDRAPAQALELMDQREAARAARDFASADALRDQLRALGWEVRDGPDGPSLLPLQ